MTRYAGALAERQHIVTDPDDTEAGDHEWDWHWSALGEPVEGHPASAYRLRLLVERLGSPGPGDTLLDIGCGQGETALLLHRQFPAVRILGTDYSASGVARAAAAAEAAGAEMTFFQRDLLAPAPVPPELRRCATVAVCSEVLEHVDDPTLLLRNATEYLAPGCRLVVTVPAGPRSAFDKHIGHRQHFRPDGLRTVLRGAGFEVLDVTRAGFPFFDLYRTMVILRGRRLVRDLTEHPEEGGGGSAHAALAVFSRLFRLNLDRSPFGWQLVAVARLAPAR